MDRWINNLEFETNAQFLLIDLVQLVRGWFGTFISFIQDKHNQT